MKPWEKYQKGPWDKFKAAQPVEPEAPMSPADGGGTLKFGPIDTGIPTSQGVERALAGAGAALTDLGLGSEQRLVEAAKNPAMHNLPFIGPALRAISMMTPEDAVQQLRGEVGEKRALDKPLLDTGAGKAGYIGGAAAPALVAGPAGATYLGAGTVGAAQGFLMPSESEQETALNTGVGAAGGVAGKFVGDRITRALSPLASRTDEGIDNAADVVFNATKKHAKGIKALQARGVRVTPGQAKGGAYKALEDKATSVPLMGDMIMRAQKQSLDDFSVGQLNEVRKAIKMPALSQKEGLTREAIEATQKAIGQQYDDVLSRLNMRADQQFLDEIANVKQMAAQGMDIPEDLAKRLNSYVKTQIEDKLTPAGFMDGIAMKASVRKLRDDGWKFIHSGDPDKEAFGRALVTLSDSIKSATKRFIPQSSKAVAVPGQLGPRPNNVADLLDLDAVDDAFSRMVPVNKAASYTANDGQFSPKQYFQAMKAGKTAKQTAAGKIKDQEFVEAAARILPNKYPDSGTAGRIMQAIAARDATSLLGSAAGALVGGKLWPVTLTGAAMYAPGVRNALTAMLTGRPYWTQPVANALARSAAAPAAGAAILNTSQ